MSKQISATEALRRANSNVRLHKCGDRWVCSEYCDTRRAWFVSTESDYWRARELRRVALARQALQFFLSRGEADYLACTGKGSARDIVRNALRSQSQK
jgi:hypothetical protein